MKARVLKRHNNTFIVQTKTWWFWTTCKTIEVDDHGHSCKEVVVLSSKESAIYLAKRILNNNGEWLDIVWESGK